MNSQRMKMVSISKKNQKLLDTIDDFGDEWELGFSGTIFKAIEEYYKLRSKVVNHKGAIVTELARTT